MGCSLLAATTPILHQNTSDQKTNFRQRANPNPYNPNSESIYRKTNSEKIRVARDWFFSFISREEGRQGRHQDKRCVSPFLPPRAEKLRVGLSVRRLLPVTGRIPDHLRGVPWHPGMVPGHIPTFYCLFPVTGLHRRERAACHSTTFLNLQLIDE